MREMSRFLTMLLSCIANSASAQGQFDLFQISVCENGKAKKHHYQHDQAPRADYCTR
jgi:hypothetical protein